MEPKKSRKSKPKPIPPTPKKRPPASKLFGEKLALVREACGYTQTELGKMITPPRHQSKISTWEDGRGVPRYHELIALAGCLGVGLRYLMDDEIPVEAYDTERGGRLPLTKEQEDLAVLLRITPIAVAIRRLAALDDPPDPPPPRRRKATNSALVSEALVREAGIGAADGTADGTAANPGEKKRPAKKRPAGKTSR